MQRFIAELSTVIEKAEFDRLWQSEASARAELKVDFAFDGRRVSATIHSESDNPWDSQSFRWAFSSPCMRSTTSSRPARKKWSSSICAWNGT